MSIINRSTVAHHPKLLVEHQQNTTGQDGGPRGDPHNPRIKRTTELSAVLTWIDAPGAGRGSSLVTDGLSLVYPAAVRTGRGSAQGRSSTEPLPPRRRRASASRAGPAGSTGPGTGSGR